MKNKVPSVLFVVLYKKIPALNPGFLKV